MAEWFGNLLLVNIIFFGWGIWGLRKTLRQNPILGRGLVRLIRRFFI
jgi:hypothetical protein